MSRACSSKSRWTVSCDLIQLKVYWIPETTICQELTLSPYISILSAPLSHKNPTKRQRKKPIKNLCLREEQPTCGLGTNFRLHENHLSGVFPRALQTQSEKTLQARKLDSLFPATRFPKSPFTAALTVATWPSCKQHACCSLPCERWKHPRHGEESRLHKHILGHLKWLLHWVI